MGRFGGKKYGLDSQAKGPAYLREEDLRRAWEYYERGIRARRIIDNLKDSSGDPFNKIYRPLDLGDLEPNHAYNFWFALSCHFGAIDPQYNLYNCDREMWVHPIAEDPAWSRRC